MNSIPLRSGSATQMYLSHQESHGIAPIIGKEKKGKT